MYLGPSVSETHLRVSQSKQAKVFYPRPISEPFQCPPQGSLIVYNGAENKSSSMFLLKNFNHNFEPSN